jgi:effector-binding domain-containing protein
VNLLGDIIGTIEKNAENVIGPSKEVVLNVNAEETKY